MARVEDSILTCLSPRDCLEAARTLLSRGRGAPNQKEERNQRKLVHFSRHESRHFTGVISLNIINRL